MYYPGVTPEGMLELYRQQYLQKRGWLRSVESRSAVDEQGNPVPWLTYPATSFLSKIIRPEWRVFEYGCGSSTAWWSQRVAEVHAVDHDPAWLERIAPLCAPNASLHLIPEDSPGAGPRTPEVERYFQEIAEPPLPADEGYCYRAGLLSARFHSYASRVLQHPSGHFDVVVIDGMARSLCTWLAVHHAQPRRLILFDNSDRDIYATAYGILKNAGYRRIDFWGCGPVNPYEWCTSVFIRDLEILP